MTLAMIRIESRQIRVHIRDDGREIDPEIVEAGGKAEFWMPAPKRFGRAGPGLLPCVSSRRVHVEKAGVIAQRKQRVSVADELREPAGYCGKRLVDHLRHKCLGDIEERAQPVLRAGLPSGPRPDSRVG